MSGPYAITDEGFKDLKGSAAVDVHGALKAISQTVWTLQFDAESELVGNPLVARLCREVQKLIALLDLIEANR